MRSERDFGQCSWATAASVVCAGSISTVTGRLKQVIKFRYYMSRVQMQNEGEDCRKFLHSSSDVRYIYVPQRNGVYVKPLSPLLPLLHEVLRVPRGSRSCGVCSKLS